MNAIEKLQKAVTTKFPRATAELEHLRAASVLDIRIDNRFYVVTWRPRRGFGLFSDQSDAWRSLSGAPDESFRSFEGIQSRITKLLGSSRKRATT